MTLPPSIQPGNLNGLPCLHIHHRECQATVALQGAQLLHFQPAGQAPLLWLSETEDFAAGRPIRGGIPLCWPWFGNNKPMAAAPAHGFARNRLFTLQSASDDGAHIHLRFTLPDTTSEHWPHASSLTLTMTLGQRATVTLTTTNTGQQPFTLTQALHSYFPVQDINATTVSGLEGSNYLEFDQGPMSQTAEVSIHGEVDRQYLTNNPVQHIHTPAGTIAVSRLGSRSLVLWNPGADKARALPQFPDNGCQHMLCLEAANVRNDSVTLAPGQHHSLSTIIGWSKVTQQ